MNWSPFQITIDRNAVLIDTSDVAVDFPILHFYPYSMNHPEFSYAKKGPLVRLVYLFVALLNLILRRVFGHKAGVIVLCFHSVTSEQRGSFERQMHYIKGRAVSLDRINDSTDRDTLVAVTFDDAFECLLENAVPLARDLHVPIAIFAVSGNLGKPPSWLSGSGHPDTDLPTMTVEQLRSLAGDPVVIIGSHSASHRRLGDLHTDEVDFELATSKASLENALGIQCRYLALPHGSYRPEVIGLAVRHGYRSVLTLDEIAMPSRWPTGTVGRFSVSPDMWMVEFILTVHGAYAWLYAWRSWIRHLRKTFADRRHAT